MIYKWTYQTPDGFDDLLMNSDGTYLTGLWFIGSKDSSKHSTSCEEKLIPIFEETIKWLDIYFSGKNPDFTPKYKINNLTPFRSEVIASQAVGGAVGWNPICIIIPCHRVVGSNGSLTGYGGGINNKVKLLINEHNDMTKFYIPTKGTAL